jgi:hypothetical protein
MTCHRTPTSAPTQIRRNLESKPTKWRARKSIPDRERALLSQHLQSIVCLLESQGKVLPLGQQLGTNLLSVVCSLLTNHVLHTEYDNLHMHDSAR